MYSCYSVVSTKTLKTHAKSQYYLFFVYFRLLSTRGRRLEEAESMMAANPATLTEKCCMFRRAHLSTHSRILVCNSIPIFNGIGTSAGCRNRVSLASAKGFRFYGSEPLGLASFQVSSGGGAGDGYGGSDGGGGSGGSSGGGGSHDSNWSFISWYLSLLGEHPVITKAVTSALLTLVGDVICQLFIDKVSSPDLKRTFIFTLLGLVLVGPTLHFWYLYLSKLVTVPGATGTFLRLFLDQFIFSPIFIGTFLSTLVTLEGRPSNVIPKLKQEWFSSVLANWQLWIPFQFLNFQFVPQQFQVLAANFIALIWNVILSYKAHKEVPAE